eukprot:TRINITY_DN3593_c0_g1_i3.p1 TRINITY_DN3593_c0_g1~~TRINITY_DN3593_c0_g1_i3.p1  ORF type:complete len:221 (-),score=49.93 TRINITY_DN3593_c0_g1_i3:180-842(-)
MCIRDRSRLSEHEEMLIESLFDALDLDHNGLIDLGECPPELYSALPDFERDHHECDLSGLKAYFSEYKAHKGSGAMAEFAQRLKHVERVHPSLFKPTPSAPVAKPAAADELQEPQSAAAEAPAVASPEEETHEGASEPPTLRRISIEPRTISRTHSAPEPDRTPRDDPAPAPVKPKKNKVDSQSTTPATTTSSRSLCLVAAVGGLALVGIGGWFYRKKRP